MTPSPQCVAFIRSWEQCRLRSYKPTPQDRWTLGWGSTGRDIGPGMVWTQAQADNRFARDLADFSHGVTFLIGTAPTSQAQFDALTSFAYNVGLDIDDDTLAEGLGDSTLLKKHKAGDYQGATAQFQFWNKQAGRVIAGLTRRRLAEADIYARGVYHPNI